MKKFFFLALMTITLSLTINISVVAAEFETDSELSLFDALENGLYVNNVEGEEVYTDNAQLSEVSLFSINTSPSATFISNNTNRQYIDNMINYYLNAHTQLLDTLKAGKPVVMFFEGGSDNVDNSNYDNVDKYRMGAVCVVLKYNSTSDSVYIAYANENCTTMPDHPLAYGSFDNGKGSEYGTATLKDGIYDIYTVNHQGNYAGFNIRNNGSGSVPAVYMKSNGGYSELDSSGINIHTRTLPYVSGKSNPWSAGCILVGASTPFTDYNTFIETTAPSTATKTTTTYKNNSIYKYSYGTGAFCGMVVMDRYLYRNKMLEIYENQSAIDCITNFSVQSYALASDTEPPTPIAPPTNVTFTIDKEKYGIDEPVNFTYWAEGASYYTVEIYKDGEALTAFDTEYGQYSTSFAEEGHYSAVISAVNSGGRTYSEWLGWDIIQKPTNVTFTIDKGNSGQYGINEPVNFTYWAEGASYYTVEIYKDGESLTAFDTEYGQYSTSFAEEGHYSAVISAVNPGGRTYSEWLGWDIIQKPTNVYFAIDKGNSGQYGINEPVNFTYWAEGVSYYTVEIYKDGASFDVFDTYYGQYSTTFNEEGHYSAIVSAVNASGRTYSGWLGWDVAYYNITYNTENKPTSLKDQIKEYNINILLSNVIPDCDNYKFIEWNTEVDGSGISYRPGDLYTENENLTLYAIWEATFPYTKSTVVKSGTKYTVATKAHNFTTPYNIVIVGYKENQFVTMKKVSHNEQNSPYTLEGDIDKIKVMVWSNLSTLKALCKAEEITSDAFIIE